MILFVVWRVAQAVATLLALLVGTFVILRLLPGGPALALIPPDYYTPEREAELNRSLGLDRPVVEQFGRWLDALRSGDLGYSYAQRQPAGKLVWERIPNTLLLGGTAWLLAVVAGLGLGVAAAARRGTQLDRLISHGAVVVLAVPAFWLGIGLIFLFAAWWRLLPSAGIETIGGGGPADRLRHLILPALTLAAGHAASLALYTRAALRHVLDDHEYVRTARAKGLIERVVLLRHALRNAAIPIATIAGLSLPHLLEGSIVVESVFAWPGIGALTVASLGRRDYPVLLLITLLAGCLVLLASLLTDLTYRWLDPRLAARPR